MTFQHPPRFLSEVAETIKEKEGTYGELSHTCY